MKKESFNWDFWLKIFLKIVVVLVIGGFGGFLFDILVLPRLIAISYFERFEFVKNLKERNIIVNPKEEIYIQENKALEEAVEKVEKTAVAVRAITPLTEISEGSGLIVTSDGLMVTFADLVPLDSEISFFLGKEKIVGQIIKRDVEKNLALIKLGEDKLTTASFADLEKIKMGQRVFLVGTIFSNKKTPVKIVNEGIIKNFSEDFIKTNMFEKQILRGSPLFDVEGNVLGINAIDNEGKVIAVPITKIKTFAGL